MKSSDQLWQEIWPDCLQPLFGFWWLIPKNNGIRLSQIDYRAITTNFSFSWFHFINSCLGLFLQAQRQRLKHWYKHKLTTLAAASLALKSQNTPFLLQNPTVLILEDFWNGLTIKQFPHMYFFPLFLNLTPAKRFDNYYCLF